MAKVTPGSANTIKSVGGLNKLDIFAIATNAFTTTGGFAFQQIYSKDIKGMLTVKGGTVTLDHDTYSEDMWTFLKAFTANTVKEQTPDHYENGVETSEGGSATVLGYGYILYVTTTNGKVHCQIGTCAAGDGTGDFKTEYDKNVRVPVVFTALPYNGTTSVTVPAAVFDTNVVAAGTTVTIAVGSYGTDVFLTAAT